MATLYPLTQKFDSDTAKIAVHDEGGVWSLVAPEFERRLPITGPMQVKNKTGSLQTIDKVWLEQQVYGSTVKDNPKMLSLFDSQKLPMNWHRIPHVTLFAL